jgi:hypothetical protein
VSYLTTIEFSEITGVCDRVARRAFAKGTWRGQILPVLQVTGNGGASGMVWALQLDKASPDLRALLKLPETLPSMPIERRLKVRPDDRHVTTATDKQRLIAAILAHPKGSCARAEAFRATAMQPHKFGTGWQRFSERTLRDWVQAAEAGGVAALMPVARSDKGKRRVRITRRWQDGCGLSEDVQEGIAAKLEGIARGLILKGRSARETRRLASTELQRLTVAAGVTLPKVQLAHLCELTGAWVMPYAEMTVARDYVSDHKRYSDNHEMRVHRELTRFPMEVLMGDVHKVDLEIAGALKSHDPRIWIMAQEAARNGRTTIRVAIIAWMDGSSHFMWATPVILGPGQGITQQDVARSLYSVITCPHGGIPREILIDNGSEFKALAEAVARFCAMAEIAGLGVIKSRPYSPEGKGRLEGAFGILEARHLSALPGYIAGDRMNSPTKSKGKRIDPYPHGPDKLMSDIHLAVAQFNGTPQSGQLAGLSPKGMLEAKIRETDWHAQVPDEATFDLVFSKEVRRDVRKGSITIEGRAYAGPVLTDLTGAKQVPFLVPMRDPEGPIMCLHNGTIHKLHHDSFALNDREGAKRKGAMVKLQNDHVKRLIAKADQTVDVQQLLSDSADLGPVMSNAPDAWTLDKAGVMGGLLSEEAAAAAEEARNRQDIEEYLAMKREGERGASGGNRNSPSSAT